MSIRLTLQYNKNPSHALIVCTPWTRWLTETKSPSGKGHVIGEEIELRKTTNEVGIITAIEIKQLERDTKKGQRYLDAAEWWLRREPFGVERLPVKLIAQNYEGSLVSVDGWNVTSLDLACPIGVWDKPRRTPFHTFYPSRRVPHPPLTLESLGLLPIDLKELRLCYIPISDLTPFHNLEILAVSKCRALRDLSGLQGCRHLRVLDVSGSGVQDLSVLAEALSLEELDCSSTSITTLAPLVSCRNIRKVVCDGCGSLTDLPPFRDIRFLEVIDVSNTAVTTLAPLATCKNLKKLNLTKCRGISNLSPLTGLLSLEEVLAKESGVITIDGLGTCVNLKKVDFSKCPELRDLSPLAGAPALEEIEASWSGVTTITGLATCVNLKKVDLSECQEFDDVAELDRFSSIVKITFDNHNVREVHDSDDFDDYDGADDYDDFDDYDGADDYDDFDDYDGADDYFGVNHRNRSHNNGRSRSDDNDLLVHRERRRKHGHFDKHTRGDDA